MEISPLQPQDILGALRLSTQSGWNQIAADWQRLLDLWPDGCFGGRVEGQLVATATLANYRPAVAWVGMVLVDEAMRGHGLGGAIMNYVIAEADRRGLACLGLDATDAGRPVYLKRGFVDDSPIERWLRPGGPRSTPTEPAVRLLRPDEWPALLAFDRAAIGYDRSELLTHLRDEAGVCCQILSTEGAVGAYGFRRPGRSADHIGPVVGRIGSEAIIASLAAASESPAIIDLLGSNETGDTLQRLGFERKRRLTRMYRGAPPKRSPENLVAAAFELG
jgi:GNAT superfamily N-acetyltransferase